MCVTKMVTEITGTVLQPTTGNNSVGAIQSTNKNNQNKMITIISNNESNSSNNIGPIKKTNENRRSNKPIMEKRRRARINNCLNELKTLILDAMKKDPARHSKLEKADILEMTVKHLENLQKQQKATMSMGTDAEIVNKFRAGFSECANEVGKFPDLEPAIKRRLLQHLANCITNTNKTDTSPSTPMNSANVTVPIVTTPMQVHILPATQKISVPQIAVPKIAAQPNIYLTSTQGNSVQLVPTRLSNGDLALVLPTRIPTNNITHLATQQISANQTQLVPQIILQKNQQIPLTNLKIASSSNSQIPLPTDIQIASPTNLHINSPTNIPLSSSNMLTSRNFQNSSPTSLQAISPTNRQISPSINPQISSPTNFQIFSPINGTINSLKIAQMSNSPSLINSEISSAQLSAETNLKTSTFKLQTPFTNQLTTTQLSLSNGIETITTSPTNQPIIHQIVGKVIPSTSIQQNHFISPIVVQQKQPANQFSNFVYYEETKMPTKNNEIIFTSQDNNYTGTYSQENFQEKNDVYNEDLRNYRQDDEKAYNKETHATKNNINNNIEQCSNETYPETYSDEYNDNSIQFYSNDDQNSPVNYSMSSMDNFSNAYSPQKPLSLVIKKTENGNNDNEKPWRPW